MIIVKNRELLIPENERYIGTNYDAGMENRLFRIPRYSPSGTDLSDLTFKINLICDGDPLDRAEMVKVIDDNFIYLTWAVTEEQVRVTGTVFVCVTGNDTNDTVKWSSFQAPFYTEKSLGDDIDTAYHDLVNKVAKEITDRENAVTAEATERQAADTTLQQNINTEAAARAAGDAAANTRIDNIVAQSGDNITEIVDARTGADSTVYASLKARLDAENSNVKSAINIVNNDVNYLGIRHINLFNTDTIVAGKYISAPGNILADNTNFFASDYIDVSGLSTITLSYTHIAYWYTDAYAPISAITEMNSIAEDQTVTVPSNAKYMRFSTYNANLNLAQVGERTRRNKYTPYENYRLPNLVHENTGIEQQLDLLNYTSNGNLYNAYNVVKEAYINPTNGMITSASGTAFAYSPSYIPVIAGESICSSGRPFVAYYDTNLNFLSGLQMDTTKTTVVPTGAKYARFSISAVDQLGVVIARGTTAPAIGRYRFSLRGLNVDAKTIIVDASGNGDYTSFTQAIYDNVDSGIPVVVKPGTYDIEAEYIALFGQSVVDNLSDSTIGIARFQFGIRVHDRTVTFMPGAHLVCDWTGRTVDGTHRFCVFRIESNAELIGLDLDCTATFYAIHDDYGTADGSPYTNIYKNCRVIAHNLTNANCIGGGCGKYSRTILQNCYFKNNVASDDVVLSADVRYHNTDVADAEPEIYISNCYFSNNFNANWYGSQTTKMRVYANNCFASKGIIKHAESSSATVDNVELFAWNNQTD